MWTGPQWAGPQWAGPLAVAYLWKNCDFFLIPTPLRAAGPKREKMDEKWILAPREKGAKMANGKTATFDPFFGPIFPFFGHLFSHFSQWGQNQFFGHVFPLISSYRSGGPREKLAECDQAAKVCEALLSWKLVATFRFSCGSHVLVVAMPFAMKNLPHFVLAPVLSGTESAILNRESGDSESCDSNRAIPSVADIRIVQFQVSL